MDQPHEKMTLEEQTIEWMEIDSDVEKELRLFPHEVYHYTTSETAKKILSQNGICFRLTHYEDFEDKLEGKIVEVYCDLALERLCRNGIISEEERFALANVEIPKRMLFFKEEHGSVLKSVDNMFAVFQYLSKTRLCMKITLNRTTKRGFVWSLPAKICLKIELLSVLERKKTLKKVLYYMANKL